MKVLPHARAENFRGESRRKSAGNSGIVEDCLRRFGRKDSPVARQEFCHGLLAPDRSPATTPSIDWRSVCAHRANSPLGAPADDPSDDTSGIAIARGTAFRETIFRGPPHRGAPPLPAGGRAAASQAALRGLRPLCPARDQCRLPRWRHLPRVVDRADLPELVLPQHVPGAPGARLAAGGAGGGLWARAHAQYPASAQPARGAGGLCPVRDRAGADRDRCGADPSRRPDRGQGRVRAQRRVLAARGDAVDRGVAIRPAPVGGQEDQVAGRSALGAGRGGVRGGHARLADPGSAQVERRRAGVW